jgi:hypothetical protein
LALRLSLSVGNPAPDASKTVRYCLNVGLAQPGA